MTRLSVHLCFNGQCEVAFRTYERLLGGNVTTMLSYGASPMAAQIAPELHTQIIHASLELDGQTLFGTDVPPPNYESPKGFCVTLSDRDIKHSKLLFEALAEGGEVSMPFQATFWSPGFGVLIDRFGIPWEVNTEEAQAM